MMGWSIGEHSGRDIGYGVPALCDHPGCNAQIDRGLSYVCGGEPYGGEHGCGLFFCPQHLHHRGNKEQQCSRCLNYRPSFTPKPDVPEWIEWKLNDSSWAKWRADNPEWVAEACSSLQMRGVA